MTVERMVTSSRDDNEPVLSFEHTHPSDLDAAGAAHLSSTTSGAPGSVVKALDQAIPIIDAVSLTGARQASRDSVVVGVLEILSDASDVDTALRACLALVRTSLGCRIGEIWLRGGESRDVELAYSSADGSSAAIAFEAAGKALGVGLGPTLIGRAMRSGRGSMVRPTTLNGAADRVAETADVGIRCVLTFPIRATSGLIGILVLFHTPSGRPARSLLEAVPVACHHLGRYLERVRANGILHERVQELSELASTDALTGLKNRREFDRALRTIPRQPFAVLSLDVDGLKAINDGEGHAAGDAVLRMVGHTLGLLVRGWDVMARVGGDEFAALLPEIGSFGAKLVAERMRVAMEALVLPTGPVRITVGWSAAPSGSDPVSVWERADECLYAGKNAGGNQVVGSSYQRGEASDIAERSYTDVITTVLGGGALSTVFQPVVNLIDGSVLGYEAFARPEGFAAVDSVEEVFEAARTSGHIRDLDAFCRRRAVEDARELPTGTTLFLNISASALIDSGHGVDELIALLRGVDRAPHTVVLDITEHENIRDYQVLSRVLAAYRAEGIRFALDDVGEGHATLELLAASSSEYLKLGRSITLTSSRAASRAVMDATMVFARLSGAVLIAEGVENEFVADLMKGAGVQFGQGFGLGRPTLAADIDDVQAAFISRAALSGLRPRSSYLFTDAPSERPSGRVPT
jgi:diguanylate cyclase (GGDEF)-like protein